MKNLLLLLLFIVFSGTAYSQAQAAQAEETTTNTEQTENVQPTGSKSGQMTYDGCKPTTNHRSYNGTRSGGSNSGIITMYRQHKHRIYNMQNRTHNRKSMSNTSRYDEAQEWWAELDANTRAKIKEEYHPRHTMEIFNKSKAAIYSTYLKYMKDEKSKTDTSPKS